MSFSHLFFGVPVGHIDIGLLVLFYFFIFNFFMPFLKSSSHLFFGLPVGHIDIGLLVLRFFSMNFFLGELAALTQNAQPGGPGFVSGLLP